MATVTIITPTYAKPELFAQCAESVLAQSYQDWVWWVVFNFDNDKGYPMEYRNTANFEHRMLPIYYPVTPWTRQHHHVTAQIVNWIYPKVTTPYIYFLADDDLIDKDGLAELVPFLNGGQDWKKNWMTEEWRIWEAVYGRCEVQNEQPDGTFKTACWCYEGTDVGLNTDITPDCKLDSSQILHTKALWDKATADGWRLSDKLEDAAHADGLLLNRLAEFATFHYVPQRINIHRRTRQSEWHKPQL